MFQNSFQTPYFEIYNSKEAKTANGNREKHQFYQKLINVSTFEYQKDLKTYILRAKAVKIPASQEQDLSLVHRYFGIQAQFDTDFHLELLVVDTKNVRRRVVLNNIKKYEQKQFFVTMPLAQIYDSWATLVVDLPSFLAVYKNSSYRSLEQITISGNCSLRRIFMLQNFDENLINQVNLPLGIPQKIIEVGYMLERQLGVQEAYVDPKELAKQQNKENLENFVKKQDQQRKEQLQVQQKLKQQQEQEQPKDNLNLDSFEISDIQPQKVKDPEKQQRKPPPKGNISSGKKATSIVKTQASETESAKKKQTLSQRTKPYESKFNSNPQLRAATQATSKQYGIDDTELDLLNIRKMIDLIEQQPEQRQHQPAQNSEGGQNENVDDLILTLNNKTGSMISQTEQSAIVKPEGGQRKEAAALPIKNPIGCTTITKKGGETVMIHQRREGGNFVTYIYDPVLDCYFDPVTQKCYI